MPSAYPSETRRRAVRFGVGQRRRSTSRSTSRASPGEGRRQGRRERRRSTATPQPAPSKASRSTLTPGVRSMPCAGSCSAPVRRLRRRCRRRDRGRRTWLRRRHARARPARSLLVLHAVQRVGLDDARRRRARGSVRLHVLRAPPGHQLLRHRPRARDAARRVPEGREGRHRSRVLPRPRRRHQLARFHVHTDRQDAMLEDGRHEWHDAEDHDVTIERWSTPQGAGSITVAARGQEDTSRRAPRAARRGRRLVPVRRDALAIVRDARAALGDVPEHAARIRDVGDAQAPRLERGLARCRDAEACR